MPWLNNAPVAAQGILNYAIAELCIAEAGRRWALPIQCGTMPGFAAA